MLTTNAERLATYERRSGWLLTVAAVLFLVVYAWPILDPDLPSALVRACSIANITIWVRFGVDYLQLRWSVRSGLCEGADRAFDGGAHVESGVDGEPVKEQSVGERHEGPGRRHGVGDADGDHDPLRPPLELAALPPQGLAKLRVAGEFEEEGVACASAGGERPGLHFGHGAQALDQPVGSRDRRHRGRVEIGALALGDPVDHAGE
jgi:hypothetical protein